MLGYRWSPQRYMDIDATYYGPNNGYARPAFIVMNANAEFPLSKILSLHASVHNLTGIYGQNVVQYDPFQTSEIGLPQFAGPANWVPGLEYGPRAFILRLDVHI